MQMAAYPVKEWFSFKKNIGIWRSEFGKHCPTPSRVLPRCLSLDLWAIWRYFSNSVMAVTFFPEFSSAYPAKWHWKKTLRLDCSVRRKSTKWATYVVWNIFILQCFQNVIYNRIAQVLFTIQEQSVHFPVLGVTFQFLSQGGFVVCHFFFKFFMQVGSERKWIIDPLFCWFA